MGYEGSGGSEETVLLRNKPGAIVRAGGATAPYPLMSEEACRPGRDAPTTDQSPEKTSATVI